jgi:UDP-GlcNAc:undecaprenyl-phosphate GlcNAc-1-phosphate transferase
MRPDLSAYLVVTAIAAVVTVLLVPAARLVAEATGLLAHPDARRLHARPTPYLGGTAMYGGFLAGMTAAWASGRFDAVFAGSTEPLAVLAAATVACAVGLVDDITDLSAPAKTTGLVLAATLLTVGGVSIIWFRIPFLDVFVLPYDLAWLFTVVWLLGMANAINFIDGLDGLAAGIVGIGAGAFLLYGVRLGEVDLLLAGNVGPLVAALAVGICLGFLPWNVHPARIFMGDSGSLLLGALMAASTMAVGGRTPDPFSGQTFFFYAPLAIPLLVLGVPVLDTAFAIFRRAKGGQGLATADKGHLHHRLVRLGHGHRRSVTILWAWTALLSAFVLYPTYNEGQGDGLVPTGVAALALLLYTLFHPGIQAGRSRPRTRPRPATAVASPAERTPTPVVLDLSAGLDSHPEPDLAVHRESDPGLDREPEPGLQLGPDSAVHRESDPGLDLEPEPGLSLEPDPAVHPNWESGRPTVGPAVGRSPGRLEAPAPSGRARVPLGRWRSRKGSLATGVGRPGPGRG